MIYLCVTKERERKTYLMMDALSNGFGMRGVEHMLIRGTPPTNMSPFAVWGQMHLATKILPKAIASERPFWHLDNGFWRPRGRDNDGYLRFCYRSLSPILLNDPPVLRMDVRMKPWRLRDSGTHVLVAEPGRDFGKVLGLNMDYFIDTIHDWVRSKTDRPIRMRPKDCARALADDLHDCWALVTHSSNVAVDAVLAGIPVFVAPSSPAAPVGRTDLEIEYPAFPDRQQWLQSLMAQQFTIQEMRSGLAADWMRVIEMQVDQAYTPVAELEDAQV